MLEVRLLGQFEVSKDGDRVEIPSRPAQSLLAYLILRAGTSHRREKLAGLLWPDSDEKNARGNLRHAIWRLRQAIGAEFIPSDKINVSFDKSQQYWLDSEVVEEEGQDGTDEMMVALTVYGGELLPGFYDDWTVLDRERLRAVFEGRVQTLLDKLLSEQRWQDASDWGERWIALGQVPEPAYRGMMIAAAGMGDTASVAAIYRRCEDALQLELSVEPSDQTRSVFEELSSGGAPGAFIGETAPPPSAAVGVERMLAGWREQGVEVLDVASLAIVHAAPTSEPFEEADSALLIRSALEHGVDVEPWLERAPSEEAAVHALVESYESYPRPKVRRRIVEALDVIEGDKAIDALTSIVEAEDNPTIRAQAAVAAATNGQLEGVVETLRLDLVTNNDASALAAFVAVADEVGLPDKVGSYPKLQVGLSLAQLRWGAMRTFVVSQMLWAGLGAAIASGVVGGFAPLYAAIWSPEDFRRNLEFVSLPGWILVGIWGLLIIGGVQGLASGFSVGVADALWSGKRIRTWRFILGGTAGLIYGGFLLLGTQVAVTQPEVPVAQYAFVLLAYGVLFGDALTFSIPNLKISPSLRSRIILAGRSAALAVIFTITAALAANVDASLGPIPRRIFFALALPFGIALGVSRRKEYAE